MTPGSQASSVNTILIRSAVPTPCFKNTANGGNRIFSTIVSKDILFNLLVHPNIVVMPRSD